MLTNNDLNDKIKGISGGSEFLEKYEYLSEKFNYIGKPTIEVLLTFDLTTLTNNFISLSTLWDIIKSNEVITNEFSKSEIEEITNTILEVNNRLDEDIVE